MRLSRVATASSESVVPHVVARATLLPMISVHRTMAVPHISKALDGTVNGHRLLTIIEQKQQKLYH